MPFVNSKASVQVKTAKVYSPSGWGNGKLWAQCTVDASVDGDTVTYTVTMNTGDDRPDESNQPMVSLWVGVDSQTVVDSGYYGSGYWSKFPLKNGSTKTGTVTTTAKNDTSIPVSIKMLVCYDYTDYDNDWDNSLITKYLTRTWYTDVTAHQPDITDAGNNTFSVSVDPGTEGNNNDVKSTTLYFRRLKSDGTWGAWNKQDSLSSTGNSINISTDPKAANYEANREQLVEAKSIVQGTYGSEVTSKVTSSAVSQYVAPRWPGTMTTPRIDCSKSRFTIKENWVLNWNSAAQEVNESSIVLGYRISLYHNGSMIPIKDLNGALISTKENNSYYYYHNAALDTTLTINPVLHDFKPGDLVQFVIAPYTAYNAGTGDKLVGTSKTSTSRTVENAGIVRVRVGSEYKEGQVYVWAGGATGGWREAETVQVWAGGATGGWKESE